MPRQVPGDQPGVLPPLYQSWIDELLDGPIPEEREATCDDCAMLARPGEQAVGSGFTFFVPTGATVSRITGTNWEGVGVLPDIAVPANKALQAALIAARQQMQLPSR